MLHAAAAASSAIKSGDYRWPPSLPELHKITILPGEHAQGARWETEPMENYANNLSPPGLHEEVAAVVCEECSGGGLEDARAELGNTMKAVGESENWAIAI